MKRFWGWLAFYAANKLGYTSWIPVDINGSDFALLLIPDGIKPEDFIKVVNDSSDAKVASGDVT
jgi:hypothetical protein